MTYYVRVDFPSVSLTKGTLLIKTCIRILKTNKNSAILVLDFRVNVKKNNHKLSVSLPKKKFHQYINVLPVYR